MRLISPCLVFLFWFAYVGGVKAAPPTDFNDRLAAFAQDFAKKSQIPLKKVEGWVKAVRFQEFTVQAYTPGKNADKNIEVTTWENYQRKMVDGDRITRGRQFFQQHQDLLMAAQQKYGVPREVIVAIIGVETRYGRIQGDFRTLDALLTLALAYPEAPNRERRAAFFRAEAETLLTLAARSGVDPLAFTGSFAGAMGIPQFMPSSLERFAVDFNQDGRINLQDSVEDAIGSVANYLAAHGWKAVVPLQQFPINASSPALRHVLASLESRSPTNELLLFSLDEFAANGLRFNLPTPPVDDRFAVISLPLGGEKVAYFLVSSNFFAITRYNISYRYALAVSLLAREIVNGS